MRARILHWLLKDTQPADDGTVQVKVSRQLAQAMSDWTNPVQMRMCIENNEWQLYIRKADAAVREQTIAAIARRQ